MTQAQIDLAVAAATGESLTTIRDRGFSFVASDPWPEPPTRCVVCPSCSCPIAFDGDAPACGPVEVECPDCDLCFAVDSDAILPTRPQRRSVP
jgi:hypothetical protein